MAVDLRSPGPIVRPVTEVPAGLQALDESARSEGLRYLSRLRTDFALGANRFDGAGEVLLEVRLGLELVGVGGLNIDPFCDDPRVGRVRRVYLHPRVRARGLGRVLLFELEARAADAFDVLRVFTSSPDAARFYEALGYQPAAGPGRVSHRKVLSSSSGSET